MGSKDNVTDDKPEAKPVEKKPAKKSKKGKGVIYKSLEKKVKVMIAGKQCCPGETVEVNRSQADAWDKTPYGVGMLKSGRVRRLG